LERAGKQQQQMMQRYHVQQQHTLGAAPNSNLTFNVVFRAVIKSKSSTVALTFCCNTSENGEQ
jgi:hypothetical protein